MMRPNGIELEASCEPIVIRVTEEYHVAQSQWLARGLAEASGFSSVPSYYVATSVTELANNLYFHTTGGGTITLSRIRRPGRLGLEIVSEDHGPGIANIPWAMQDGSSTNGGLGGGLPGVKRLMDEFEISSTPVVGTRIMARKWMPCR